MKESLRLLQIEDNDVDAELVRRALERDDFDLRWECVDSGPALELALAQPWDVVISDFAMPGFSGLRAHDMLKTRGVDTPFIFVSGTLGEERAVEAMRAGASDYFVKGNLALLPSAVRRGLAEVANRRQRQLIEDNAAKERRRLELAIEATNSGVFDLGLVAGTADYGGPWENLVGLAVAELPHSAAEFQGWLGARVHPDDAATRDELLIFLGGGRERFNAEFRIKHLSGRWVDVAVFARAAEPRPNGRFDQVAGVFMDLTASRQLEGQLRQSQKMEAVGQLAGGVAHDFNNLLTAILSYGRFAFEEVAPDSQAAGDIGEVLNAARRAQELTAHLLAFSRKTPIVPRILNVNEIVKGAERMLRRLIGEDVDLISKLASDLYNVRIDQSAFEQVLVNLAVNARDAMSADGTLIIETDNVELDDAQVSQQGAGIPPGHYVVIAVSDSGTGMDAATQARIFEPFFTTKEVGRGTGLGLSTCYGIVKQAGGFIWVYSVLGHGTTFRIYLPRVADPHETRTPDADPVRAVGSEVILLVEDNAQVRQATARALGQCGYTVIEAASGKEALERFHSANLPIDLLLTDVVMPGIGGKELVEKVRELNPSLPVLFMSGYTPIDFWHQLVFEQGTEILQKPFTADSLSRKVRQVLGEREVDSGPLATCFDPSPSGRVLAPLSLFETSGAREELTVPVARIAQQIWQVARDLRSESGDPSLPTWEESDPEERAKMMTLATEVLDAMLGHTSGLSGPVDPIGDERGRAITERPTDDWPINTAASTDLPVYWALGNELFLDGPCGTGLWVGRAAHDRD